MGPDILEQLNKLLDRHPHESIERTKLLKARDIILNAQTEPEDAWPQPCMTNSSHHISHLSPTQRRLQYLRTIPVDSPQFTEEDRINHRGVIEAYETGQLRVEDRREGDVAVFSNGRLVQGWGAMNPYWRHYLGGKCWTEEG